jgi:hypothetical protein
VIDLTFKEGTLLSEQDRAVDMLKLREAQATVGEFLSQHRLDEQTILELEARCGIPKWRIPDAFSLDLKEIDVDGLVDYLEALEKHLHTPWWFVLAINRHYRQENRLSDLFSLPEMRRVGLPDDVLRRLSALVTDCVDETTVVVAFLYVLSTTEVGKHFEGMPLYVIARHFEKRPRSADLLAALVPAFRGLRHDSWPTWEEGFSPL